MSHLVLREVRLRGATQATVRTAKFQQRDHVVVPVIALVEGVIHPFNAPTPEFVPADVIAKAPKGWDGRPVVGNHPVSGTQAISANEPGVLERQSFGILFNTTGADGKLHTEAWLDVAKAQQVGEDAQRVIERAKNPEAAGMIEVSVGAYVIVDDVQGEFHGKQYGARWKEIVPDHLAMLPEGVPGACSNEMGCGAPRTAMHRINASGGIDIVDETTPAADVPLVETPQMEERRDGLHAAQGEPMADTRTDAAPPAPKEKRSWRNKFVSLFEKFRGAQEELRGGAQNEESVSDRDLRELLDRALFAAEAGYLGIDTVFPSDSLVVYAIAPEDKLILMRRGFTQADGAVELKDDRVEVHAVTNFEPVNATAAPAGEPTPPAAPAPAATCGCGGARHAADENETHSGATPMKTKQERVQALIDDKRTPYGPEDKTYLESQPDERITAIEAHVSAPAPAAAPVEQPAPAAQGTTPAPQATAPTQTPAQTPAPAPVQEPVAATTRPRTAEEFMAEAPAEIKDIVARARAADALRRGELVTGLKAAQSAYTEAELQAMPMNDLERLAAVAKVARPEASQPIDYIAARAVPRPVDAGVIPPPPDLTARVRAARGLKAQ